VHLQILILILILPQQRRIRDLVGGRALTRPAQPHNSAAISGPTQRRVIIIKVLTPAHCSKADQEGKKDRKKGVRE